LVRQKFALVFAPSSQKEKERLSIFINSAK